MYAHACVHSLARVIRIIEFLGYRFIIIARNFVSTDLPRYLSPAGSGRARRDIEPPSRAPLVNPVFRATAYTALMPPPKGADCRCDRFPAHPRLRRRGKCIRHRRAKSSICIKNTGGGSPRRAWEGIRHRSGIRAPLRRKCKMEKRVRDNEICHAIQ